jgi:hypothetical protein
VQLPVGSVAGQEPQLHVAAAPAPPQVQEVEPYVQAPPLPGVQTFPLIGGVAGHVAHLHRMVAATAVQVQVVSVVAPV